jgi:hypothetical protein
VDVELDSEGVTYALSGLEMDTLQPSEEKIVAKFRRLTAALPADRSEEILERVLNLENLGRIEDLTALLQSY